MQNPTIYTVLSHLDAPLRYFTLTMDELVIAMGSLLLLVMSSHKLVVGVLGFSLFMLLKHLKGGAGPRALLVLAYWYLPHSLTKFFLPTLPASHMRVWVA